MNIRLLLVLFTVAIIVSACNDSNRQDGQSGSPPVQSGPADEAGSSGAGQLEADRSGSGNENPCTADTPLELGNPCEIAEAGGGLPMRGTVTTGENGLMFRPCSSAVEIPLMDTQEGLLAELLAGIDPQAPGLYVQMDASSDGEYLVPAQLWRASALGSSLGCKEDLSGLLYLARGSDPDWGVEVRAEGQIALLLPNEERTNMLEILYDFTGREMEGQDIVYNAVNPKNQALLKLIMRSTSVKDPNTGDWFGMRADLRVADLLYTGYAWPGESPDFLEGVAGSQAAQH